MANNPIWCFDFTTFIMKENGNLKNDIIDYMKLYCKKWGFQEEECPTTGTLHYQCRISLKERSRKIPVCEKFHCGNIKPTSKDNSSGVAFYAYITKEDTRVNGPWTDKDEEIYIPRQIREINELYSWQEFIVSTANNWDKRTINYVYNTSGNVGKSTLVGYCRAYKIGRFLPPVNDAKDLLRMVCDLPTSKMYLFDLPRAMNKERLYGFWTAIETIKDGYAYDDRYKFQEKVFDCPIIWIFGNTLPDIELLSRDRWKIWDIKDQTLVDFCGASL